VSDDEGAGSVPMEESQPTPASPGSETEPSRLRVFISYRADPDAPVAAALKRLIESSIEPQPTVFVAGEGGLRPANVGFKMQLQTAAQSAHAFVAIITNSSKDREWIFFEAGAAWGRNLLYAPVLVGSKPEDLPSTIGDYQALKAQSKDDMYWLMQSLAGCVAAEVKDRFGQRYLPFARTVEQQLQGDPDPIDSNAGGQAELARAFRLALDGNHEQSAEIFHRLEEDAPGAEEKAQINVIRIHAERKSQEVVQALEGLDDTLKNTSVWNINMAYFTERPLQKAAFFHRAVDIGQGRSARTARFELARLRFQLGQDAQGRQDLLSLIEDGGRDEYAEEASIALVELLPELQAIEKVLICLTGLSGSRPAGYRQLADLALKNNWSALHLFCAAKVDSLAETGASANSHGIALARAGLGSRAFEAYSIAYSRGVSVARCNMAQLINSGAMPAAALKLIKEHEGEFDSADPGYPHDLKAKLERALGDEREREKRLLKAGEKQLNALWAFADSAFRSRKTPPFRPKGRLLCGKRVLPVDNLASGPLSGKNVFEALPLLGQNVFCAEVEGFIGLIVTAGDSVDGMCFEDFSNGEGLSSCVWISETVFQALGPPSVSDPATQ